MIPKLLLSHICNDVRSTTGKNLRSILLETDKSCVELLVKSDVNHIKYHPVGTDEQWRVGVLNELIDYKEGRFEVEGFDDDEVDQIINYNCTS